MGERVFLGLGSNQGDRRGNLDRALEALRARPDVDLVRCSAVLETEPWGVTDQPGFLNAVVEVGTTLEPVELLLAAKAIEAALGRTPTFRWGPRVIDIDIIAYGRRVIASDELTVPHARCLEREFVMGPLREIAPEVAEELEGRG